MQISKVQKYLRRAVRHLAGGTSHPDSPVELPDTPLLFDEAAFRRRETFRPNYDRVSEALVELLSFDTVLDLGCGNGFLLDALLVRGKDITGVELSQAVLPLLSTGIRDRVRIGNAATLGGIGRFDLVACVEVAEHIDPADSESLLNTITANAGKWVYFTAAPPHQPGHGHINCRPQFFWMNEFRKRGFAIEWEKTEKFVERIADLQPAVWLPLNSMIFSRT